MRQWTYSWTSSDGLRHEGEIFARCKDDAYSELRRQGIHPIRVTERIVPVVRRGLRGLRKRDMMWLALIVLALLIVAWCFAVASVDSAARAENDLSGFSVDSILSDPKRRDEVRRIIEERRAFELECREDLVRRVMEGTLSKETANQMFSAMGMEELE